MGRVPCDNPWLARALGGLSSPGSRGPPPDMTPDVRSLFAAVTLASASAAAANVPAPHLTAHLAGHYAAGARPTTACLSPDGSLLYVSDRDSNLVTVLDTKSLSPLKTWSETGYGPWGLAVNTKQDRVYAGDWGGMTVTVIDAATGKQAGQVEVGIKPSYVALAPDGKRLFAAGNLTHDVSFVDLPSLHVARSLDVGLKPMGVAVTPNGRWLFVAASDSQKIAKVDLKHEVVLESHAAPLAATTNLVVTPDGRKVLAAGSANRLLVMDVETGDVAKIRVGADPAGVAVTPDGSTAFVANYGSGTVSVVDLALGTSYDELPAARGTIDVQTDGKRLYTCNDQAGSVTVYDLAPIQAAALPPAAAPVGG